MSVLTWIANHDSWVLPLFNFVVVIASIKYIFFGLFVKQAGGGE